MADTVILAPGLTAADSAEFVIPWTLNRQNTRAYLFVASGTLSPLARVGRFRKTLRRVNPTDAEPTVAHYESLDGLDAWHASQLWFCEHGTWIFRRPDLTGSGMTPFGVAISEIGQG